MVGLAAGCILYDLGEGGLGYIEALCRSWALDGLQRQAVAFYAAERALEFLDHALAQGDGERSERLRAGVDAWLRGVEQA
ncbi:MAG TPA: hypothetical protein VFK80_09725 [Limnochordia bacterium]|nr:hypothetical protein [Limnochordia bacterium]